MMTFARMQNQRGFTLLESLVALIILSVGMLGIAALYVEGLRSGRTAIYRTTAVNLAADMMDRIRANPAAREEYEKAGKSLGCVDGDKDCTPSELAQDDVAAWEAAVAVSMPAGAETDINVTDIDPYFEYEIEVTWPEPGYEEKLSYTLIGQL